LAHLVALGGVDEGSEECASQGAATRVTKPKETSMTLYKALELTLLGVLVAHLFGLPQPLGRAVAAILFVLLLVLAFTGRHS
jgi:hypothetical protein